MNGHPCSFSFSSPIRRHGMAEHKNQSNEISSTDPWTSPFKRQPSQEILPTDAAPRRRIWVPERFRRLISDPSIEGNAPTKPALFKRTFAEDASRYVPSKSKTPASQEDLIASYLDQQTPTRCVPYISKRQQALHDPTLYRQMRSENAHRYVPHKSKKEEAPTKPNLFKQTLTEDAGSYIPSRSKTQASQENIIASHSDQQTATRCVPYTSKMQQSLHDPTLYRQMCAENLSRFNFAPEVHRIQPDLDITGPTVPPPSPVLPILTREPESRDPMWSQEIARRTDLKPECLARPSCSYPPLATSNDYRFRGIDPADSEQDLPAPSFEIVAARKPCVSANVIFEDESIAIEKDIDWIQVSFDEEIEDWECELVEEPDDDWLGIYG